MSEELSRFHTRPSLLLRLRDKADAHAWREFVDVYAPLMQTYCRRRGLQPADAADVIQAIFQKLCVVFDKWQYDPARGRFRDWLGTVTKNEVSRFVKRQERGADSVSGDHLDEAPGGSEDPIWAEEFTLRLLHAALERIRPDFEPTTWRIFELTWREGRPAAEVVAELGISFEKVFHAKSRVLKRLRAEIVELGGDTVLFAGASD